MPGSAAESGNVPTESRNAPTPPVPMENKPGTPGFVAELAVKLDAVIEERGNLFAERNDFHIPYPGKGEKAKSNVMKNLENRRKEDALDLKEGALTLLWRQHQHLVENTEEPDLGLGPAPENTPTAQVEG